MKVEVAVPGLPVPPNKPTVSVDVKQHFNNNVLKETRSLCVLNVHDERSGPRSRCFRR